MPKFKVMCSFTKYEECVVTAKNEQAAKEKATEIEREAWSDNGEDDFEIYHVEKISK